MHVLLVKLSSMGDLIHALPAISDAVKVNPELTFDWVIDEAFFEVASWHPAVRHIIKSAHRRWRKTIGKTFRNKELSKFLNELRTTQYDLVIDGQNNMKSGLVTRFAKGPRWGLDRKSAREPLASLAYQHTVHVPKNEHAITRMRQLFSLVFDYPLPTTPPEFGIDETRLREPRILNIPDDYLFFVHNASWTSKLWPEPYWRELIEIAHQHNIHVLMPSGNQVEYERSKRLCEGVDTAIPLPKMALSEVAYLLKRARAAICVDTGLSHLAAALNTSSINIYGSTDPGLIGAKGEHSTQINLYADFPCAPCYKGNCVYKQASSVTPACYTKIPPIRVWNELEALLAL